MGSLTWPKAWKKRKERRIRIRIQDNNRITNSNKFEERKAFRKQHLQECWNFLSSGKFWSWRRKSSRSILIDKTTKKQNRKEEIYIGKGLKIISEDHQNSKTENYDNRANKNTHERRIVG